MLRLQLEAAQSSDFFPSKQTSLTVVTCISITFINYVRLQVLMMASIKVFIFCDVALCILVGIELLDVLEVFTAFIIRTIRQVAHLKTFSFCQATRHIIPEDSRLHSLNNS